MRHPETMKHLETWFSPNSRLYFGVSRSPPFKGRGAAAHDFQQAFGIDSKIPPRATAEAHEHAHEPREDANKPHGGAAEPREDAGEALLVHSTEKASGGCAVLNTLLKCKRNTECLLIRQRIGNDIVCQPYRIVFVGLVNHGNFRRILDVVRRQFERALDNST